MKIKALTNLETITKINAANRDDRIQNSRKTSTKTIRSQKDKQNCPKKQRKTKPWLND